MHHPTVATCGANRTPTLGACADGHDENLQRQSATGNGSLSAQDKGQTLHTILQPLVKAACSARGKRPCQDAPGTVLASAIRALSEGQDRSERDVHEVADALIDQLASMLAHGTLSVDVAGSFQALRAAWEQQRSSTVASGKTTRNSLQAVCKALASKAHWAVRSKIRVRMLVHL